MPPNGFRVGVPGEFQQHEDFFAEARRMAERVGKDVQAMAIDPYRKTFWLACFTEEARKKAEEILGDDRIIEYPRD